MQIQNILIQNFKSIKSFSLSPKKVTMLVGHNGTGKSSVLEAVRYLLTGECPESPVASGETRATVEGEFLGVSVYRGTGDKTVMKLNGKNTTQKAVTKMMEDALGCTMDTIKVSTSANVLAAMNAGQLSDYLVNNKLIPAEIDLDLLYSLCPVTENGKTELAMLFPPAPMLFDMAAIDEAYAHFYAARTTLKSQLKTKEAEAKFEGVIPTRSIADVDADLIKLSAYDSELEAYNKLMEAYNTAINHRNEVLREIETVEQKINTAENVSPVDPKEKEFLEQQLSRNTEELDAISKTIETIRANNAIFERTLASLEKPICPISNKLVCTTDKTAIQGELTQLVTDNQAEINKAEERAAILKNNNEAIRKKAVEYDRKLTAYNEYKSLFESLDALRKAVPPVPEKPVEPIKSEDSYERKKALHDERTRILKYESSRKAEAEVERLSKAIEVHDELVKLLSPKSGIREKIMQIALEPIIEHCNNRAKMLKLDFEVGLKVENGVHIVCRPNTGAIVEPLPLESVSSGEQAYALFLIMDSLNALHGLGILMLDDLDKLDAMAFWSLLNLLKKEEVLESYDHIFLAAVDHKDTMDTIDSFRTSLINEVIAM